MLSSLIPSLIPSLNLILIKVILISIRFAMEHSDHQKRDAGSSASVEQDNSIHEEEDQADGASIDPPAASGCYDSYGRKSGQIL